MTNQNGELIQGNGGGSLPSPNSQPQSQPGSQYHLSPMSNGNAVFKSGPLFISSKGIGWTSWKKRWFVLKQTSLVFFRNDPSAVSQKGNEVNLTLGGIDLNNSGSVVVKEDKKLLTVQFPNACDGRAFTLKAETTEDLYEWKTALENALAQAPGPADVKGQKGIFRNDQTDSSDISSDQLKDRDTVKFKVIGRPILLALEEVDGTPSFLEKALRFIEEHGVKVEGILRQAADVEHVEHRLREYEQGKVEFSEEEDAHVIADCVKHVLRELPSSPVPASCCKALLEACRTERVNRVSAMRAAICDTFPEPNLRLLRRLLMMMQSVASCKAVNRMNSPAVAACMAPLLLRPLLAGECEIENDFDLGGDGSAQLLQAAAAANHAQAIVITLLEEYHSIFGGYSMSPGPDLYSDSEVSGSETEEASDDDWCSDDYSDGEQDESIQESEVDEDDYLVGETGDSVANSEYDDDKDGDLSCSSSKSSDVSEEELEADQMLSSTSLEASEPPHEDIKSHDNVTSPIKTACADGYNKHADIKEDLSTDQTTMDKSNSPDPPSCMKKSRSIPNGPARRRCIALRRNSGRKNLSMESIDYCNEDEAEIEGLEAVKTELQNQIAEKAKANANAKLQSDMNKQKKALQERRLALKQDVARLQEQLKKEKSYQVTLEAQNNNPPGPLSDLSSTDEKTKAGFEELLLVAEELANLQRKVDELGVRLNNVQLERNHGSMLDFSNQNQQISNHEKRMKNKPDTEFAATSPPDRPISKNTHFARADYVNERKPESTPLPNILPPGSKKPGTKGDNAIATALTTLTSRLNFLKERRSQPSNDFQNMDKGREFSHPGQNLQKKGKVSELQNVDKGRELSHPGQNLQKKGKVSDLHPPLPSPIKPRGYDFFLPLLANNWPRAGEGAAIEGPPSDKQRKSDRQNQHP